MGFTVDALRRRQAGQSLSKGGTFSSDVKNAPSSEKGLTFPQAIKLVSFVMILASCAQPNTQATPTLEGTMPATLVPLTPTEIAVENPTLIEATAIPKIEMSMASPIDGLYYGSYGIDAENQQVITGAISAENFNANNPNSQYKTPSYGNGEVQVNTLYSETNAGTPAATMLDQQWLDGYFKADTDKSGVTTGVLPDGSMVTKKGLFWVNGKGDVLNPLVRNIAGENFGWPMLTVKDNQLFTAVVDGDGNLVGNEQFSPAFQSPSAIAESVGFENSQQVAGVALSDRGILEMYNAANELIGQVKFVGNAEIAPLIEIDGTMIKDPTFSNPELFDVTDPKSPLSKFVNAFVVAQEGETKPAFQARRQTVINEVMSELKPNLFTVEDKQYVILTTQDISSTEKTNESNIPLIIAEKNESNEWVWTETPIKKMCDLNGLKCGSTISGDENYTDPDYNTLLTNEFSIINSGGTSPDGVRKWGWQFEEEYSKFAQQNGISFRPGHLFDWGDANPSELSTSSNAEITSWMNQWVSDVVNKYPYFDSINFANEPVGIYDGQYWVNEHPWYKVYGEQWPVEAYSMIFNELEAKGLKPGEDVHLILNLPYGAKEWGYNTRFTIDFMRQMQQQIQAKMGPNAKMDIGIQFHLRDVPQSQVDWGGPDIKDLDQAQLTKFFQDLGVIGQVHITELSTKNVQNHETAMEGIDLVMTAAIQSGAVKDVVFWEALKTNDFLFNEELQNNPDYYLFLQTLYSNLATTSSK